ncbi:MAG TPA: hypothetical protein VGM10_14745 [Actinocrinis sp.]
MTSIVHDPAGSETAGTIEAAAPPATRRPARPPLVWYSLLAAAFVLGAVMFRFAYAEAFAHALTGGDPAYHYTVYWIGMALFLVPASLRLLRANGVSAGERKVLLIAVAVFTYIPRVLRSPSQPLFFDELAHWSQSEHLYQSGKLFQPNVVAIVADYPGLHILTVAAQHFSGLDTYQVGLVIGGLSHVLELLAVFVLVRRLFGSQHTAGLAGLCYALNPGYLLFTAQYAYESLALILVAWAIVLAQEASRPESPRATRWRWTAATGVVIAATAVTHHLSSLFLVFVLVVHALAHRPWRDWERGRYAVWIAVIGIAANALWMGTLGSSVFTYLAPYPREGFEQILSFFSADGQSGSGRSAFQASSLPRYEMVLALAAPVVVSLLGVIGAWLSRRRWRTSPMLRTVFIVSVCYPLSLPFVLTTAGAPGAHRSWPFTYLLLSGLLAFTIAAACSGTAGRRGGPGRPRRVAFAARSRRINALLKAGAIAVVMALIVGNSGSENNNESMFPGPWQVGTDARTESPELLAVAAWAKQTQGGGHNFISDYTTGGVFGAFADDDFLVGFPSWDLYFYDAPPKPQTLQELGPDKVDFMLVDSRLSEAPFESGFYFEPSEPEAYTRTSPISLSALEKFTAYPWAVKIYQSQHYALYRLEPGELNAGVYGVTP